MPKTFTARAILTDKEVSIHKVKEEDRFHYLMLENEETQFLLTFGDILMLHPSTLDDTDPNNTPVINSLRMHLSLSNFHSFCIKHHESMILYRNLFSHFDKNTSLDFLEVIEPISGNSPRTLIFTQKEHDTPDTIHRNVLYFLKGVYSNIYSLLELLPKQPPFIFNLHMFPDDIMRTHKGIDIDPEMADGIMSAISQYANTQWTKDVDEAYHNLSINSINTEIHIYTKCMEIAHEIDKKVLDKVRWTYKDLFHLIDKSNVGNIDTQINHKLTQ